MLKTIFKKAVTRFSDIQGRPWQKMSFIDRVPPPYLIAGAMTSSGFAYTAVMLPDAAYYAAYVGMKSVMVGALGYEFMRAVSAKFMPMRNQLADYAIDREGRSFPPHNNHSLMQDAESGHFQQRLYLTQFLAVNAVLMGVNIARGKPLLPTFVFFESVEAVTAIKYLGGIFLNDMAVFAVPLSGFYLGMRRFEKLLDKEYVFCDRPPAMEREAQRKLSSAVKPSMT